MNDIPSTDNWPGDFNFHVRFDQPPNKQAKSAPWVYSELLKRLFVGLSHPFPVHFHMNIPVHKLHEYCIRGKLMFADTDWAQEVVERCETHKNHDAMKEYAAHILRVTNTSGFSYENQGLRRSVLVPLENRTYSANNNSIDVEYSFACLSSCPTLKRRRTKLIFTLEHKQGHEVGRFCVDTHSCACPGRDAPSAEKKIQRAGRTRRRRTSRCPEADPLKPQAADADDDDDNEFYTLSVRAEYFPRVLKMVERMAQESNRTGKSGKPYFRLVKK